MSSIQRTILFSVIISFFCFGQAHAQARLGSEEAESLVIDKAEPIYPAIAKAARAQGTVKIEITVSDQGLVTSAKAISGHPFLQAAALDAVKKRRYKAHMVGGRPVSFIYRCVHLISSQSSH